MESVQCLDIILGIQTSYCSSNSHVCVVESVQSAPISVQLGAERCVCYVHVYKHFWVLHFCNKNELVSKNVRSVFKVVLFFDKGPPTYNSNCERTLNKQARNVNSKHHFHSVTDGFFMDKDDDAKLT